MLSFRFSGDSGALYGAYSSPPESDGAARGVLLCNPFGQEAVRSQRMYRVLADRIARACGQPALRFDYYGTGDSDGEGEEGSIEQWVRDTLAADAELRSRSGCREVAWIGLRLGATIAAIASSRAVQPPTRLLLWEPVVDGPAWLAELEASHRQEITRAYAWVKGRPNPAQASLTKPLRESVGFPLPDALLAELAALRPTVFSGAACRELICLSSRPPEVAIRSWNSSRHEQSGEAVWRQVSETNWNSDEAMNSAIVPADVIATIMEELART